MGMDKSYSKFAGCPSSLRVTVVGNLIDNPLGNFIITYHEQILEPVNALYQS